MPEYRELSLLKKSIQESDLTAREKMACLLCLSSVPVADVEPVRHGRWRWIGADRWNDAFECSECGRILMDDSNYCPNCGAKMDSEETT